MWVLTLDGRAIHTTGEHPFFAEGHGWKPLAELAVGDRLLGENCDWLTIEALEDTGRYETVYNLKVSDFSTYFVGSEDWGFSVWAHNANYGDPLVKAQVDAAIDADTTIPSHLKPVIKAALQAHADLPEPPQSRKQGNQWQTRAISREAGGDPNEINVSGYPLLPKNAMKTLPGSQIAVRDKVEASALNYELGQRLGFSDTVNIRTAQNQNGVVRTFSDAANHGEGQVLGLGHRVMATKGKTMCDGCQQRFAHVAQAEGSPIVIAEGASQSRVRIFNADGTMDVFVINPDNSVSYHPNQPLETNALYRATNQQHGQP